MECKFMNNLYVMHWKRILQPIPWRDFLATGEAFIQISKWVEKSERQGSKKEGRHKQSEETEYKIHMTGLVILNANAGCVFAGVTHWFFYW